MRGVDSGSCTVSSISSGSNTSGGESVRGSNGHGIGSVELLQVSFPELFYTPEHALPNNPRLWKLDKNCKGPPPQVRPDWPEVKRGLGLPQEVLDIVKQMVPYAFKSLDPQESKAPSTTPIAPKKLTKIQRKLHNLLLKEGPEVMETIKTGAIRQTLTASVLPRYRATISGKLEPLIKRLGMLRHLGVSFFNAFIMDMLHQNVDTEDLEAVLSTTAVKKAIQFVSLKGKHQHPMQTLQNSRIRNENDQLWMELMEEFANKKFYPSIPKAFEWPARDRMTKQIEYEATSALTNIKNLLESTTEKLSARALEAIIKHYGDLLGLTKVSFTLMSLPKYFQPLLYLY